MYVKLCVVRTVITRACTLLGGFRHARGMRLTTLWASGFAGTNLPVCRQLACSLCVCTLHFGHGGRLRPGIIVRSLGGASAEIILHQQLRPLDSGVLG